MREWRTERLGAVCDLITRGIAPVYVEAGGLCVINQKCVRDHVVNLGLARRHDNTAKAVSPERLIQAGDVLVNSTGKGTLGRVAQIRDAPSEPTTVDSHVTIIRPKTELFHAGFFGYVMTTIEAGLTAAGEGSSGQTELPRSKLENGFEVQFPRSLEVQKRVVDILDESFEWIAKAEESSKAALSSALGLLSAFRDNLLRGGPDWLPQTLGQVCKIKHGFAFESRYFTPEGDYVLLTPGNFYERGGYRDRGHEQKRYRGPTPPAFVLQPGALLVAMTEQAAGLLGSPLIVPEGRPCLHNQRLGLAVPNPEAAWDDRFFFHLFNSASFRQYLHDGATGTKVRHTSPGKIEAFEARIPPTRAEQAYISQRIDAVEKEAVALVTIHSDKLSALAELKKSLLTHAFSGELIREPLAA